MIRGSRSRPRGVAMGALALLLGALTARGAAPAPSGARGPEEAPAPAVLELRAELTRLISGPGWGDDRWGVLVVSLDRGDTLFAHQPDQPLAPASNMKLLTTAAGLHYLGPGFRYGTYLLADGAVREGVLEGDLVLYGTGDPTLGDSTLGAFADSLAALDIRRVTGDVVGDGSYFGAAQVPRGWDSSYVSAAYAALPSALSFNENVVSLRITPAEPGSRPDIQYIPGGRGIAVVNLATTGSGRPVRVDRVAYDGPIVVEGGLLPGAAAVWRQVPVADPAHYTAAALREALERRGIAVQGVARSVRSPARSVVTRRTVFAPRLDGEPTPHLLATHRSVPLLEILSVINQRSHNMYAEQVLRTVGRVALGSGSAEAGERAIRAFLEDQVGFDAAGLEMNDGSGLSRTNRASPGLFVALLEFMAHSEQWTWYWETLPEAGVSRGLRRMQQTAAEANLRAKTGTIDSVSALSGYVRAANGERLGFSIISNRVPSTWRAKRVEDAIGGRLADFARPMQASAAPQPTRTQAQPPPEPEPEEAAQAARTVTIKSGDTLEGIARRHGVSVSALRGANPGVNERRLIPGRELKIP